MGAWADAKRVIEQTEREAADLRARATVPDDPQQLDRGPHEPTAAS